MPSTCFPPSRSFEQLALLLQVQLSDQKQLEVFGAALAEHCLLFKNRVNMVSMAWSMTMKMMKWTTNSRLSEAWGISYRIFVRCMSNTSHLRH